MILSPDPYTAEMATAIVPSGLQLRSLSAVTVMVSVARLSALLWSTDGWTSCGRRLFDLRRSRGG
jgi:hypothetical protein